MTGGQGPCIHSPLELRVSRLDLFETLDKKVFFGNHCYEGTGIEVGPFAEISGRAEDSEK
jgi:hypothetical protein